MAFTYAYNLNGVSPVVIKDFAIAAGYTPKRGDLVYLDGTGKLNATAVNTASALGVISDSSFVGIIASGQPYAASTITGVAGGDGTKKGKVMLDASAVYRVVASAAPTIGTQYAVKLVGSDYQLDVANTAGSTKFATCVDYDSTTGNAFVVLDVNRQIV